MPEKSGLPSVAIGAGAFRSGAPVEVLGTPGVGYFNHCAERSWQVTRTAARTRLRVWLWLSGWDLKRRF